nr:PREDICTED: TP53-regulated inhibitor of apoptosis 1 [Opisthocomus hoazin]
MLRGEQRVQITHDKQDTQRSWSPPALCSHIVVTGANNIFLPHKTSKAIKEKDIPIEGLEFMGPSKGKTENSS